MACVTDDFVAVAQVTYLGHTEKATHDPAMGADSKVLVHVRPLTLWARCIAFGVIEAEDFVSFTWLVTFYKLTAFLEEPHVQRKVERDSEVHDIHAALDTAGHLIKRLW